jgi:hypothetical protein
LLLMQGMFVSSLFYKYCCENIVAVQTSFYLGKQLRRGKSVPDLKFGFSP